LIHVNAAKCDVAQIESQFPVLISERKQHGFLDQDPRLLALSAGRPLPLYQSGSALAGDCTGYVVRGQAAQPVHHAKGQWLSGCAHGTGQQYQQTR